MRPCGELSPYPLAPRSTYHRPLAKVSITLLRLPLASQPIPWFERWSHISAACSRTQGLTRRVYPQQRHASHPSEHCFSPSGPNSPRCDPLSVNGAPRRVNPACSASLQPPIPRAENMEIFFALFLPLPFLPGFHYFHSFSLNTGVHLCS